MPADIQRKLAAVMFTDIVGFTEHMSVDETSALNLLNEKISITKPLIKKHKGSYVKNIGDGTLSYFDSATEAIECATTIQNVLKNRVDLRIGLHLGEVIVKDGDILGDSVNIASRIEKLSSKGGVCLSSTIYNQLKNKKKYNLKHLGLHSFKGVGRLLDVYGIKTYNAAKNNKAVEVERPNESDFSSISIIPLRNKGKKEDDFYAYSLSLDIFSKISSTSNIITSSMEDVEALMPSYKSKEISKKLQTRYCLSGSLWKKDNFFNLSLELFDHNNKKIIWADSWLEDWNNLPNIESTISGNLIKILDSSSSSSDSSYSNITDSEAYRIYLKGKYVYHNRQTNKDVIKAEALFNESISIDNTLIPPRMLLGEILYQQGEYQEALSIFKINLKMSLSANDSKNISSCLSAIGAIYFQSAEYDKALEYNLQALKIRQKINNVKGIAKSYNALGAIHDMLKDYDKALNFYKDAIQIWEKINDESDMAPAVFNISNLYNTKGDLDSALKSVKESIQLSKRTKNKPLLGYSYNLLGAILSNKKRLDESLKYLKKALKIKKELNEPEGIASALKSIGIIYYLKGQYKQAMVFHKKSLKVRKSIGYKVGVAKSLKHIGDTFKKIGDYNQSIEAYKESLSIMQSIEDYDESSKIMNKLGNIYRKMGKYEEALNLLLKAKDIKNEIQDFKNLGYTLLEISSAYRWQGDYKMASKYNLESIAIAEQYDMQKLLANNFYHQSLMLINKGNYKEARAIIEKAIIISKKIDSMSNVAKYLDCLGIILRHERRFEESVNVVNEALAISEDLGDKHGLRKYLNSIGLTKERYGDFKGALKLYIKCLDLSKTINEKRSIAVSYNNIAGMYLLIGNYDESLRNQKKAFSYAKRINYKEGEAGFAFNIATHLLRQKKYTQSLKYINISIQAFQDMENPYLIECYVLRTYIYMMNNDKRNTLECYEYIKDISSNNEYGHIRNWELYKINLYLGNEDGNFLENAYNRMVEDLEVIKSKKSKELFLENFTYGKLINKEFNRLKK